MTIDEVKSRVAEIAKCEGKCHEGGHALMDDLWEDLLTAIADGSCTNPAECAAEAVAAKDLDLCIWYD